MNTLATSREPNIDARLRALRRANFRMIEAELYNYRWSRQMLAQALKELNLVADSTVMSPPTDEDRVQTSRYFSDIVASKAEELMRERAYTVAVLQETARRLDAIEYMLRRFEQDPIPGKKRLVELRYFEGRLTDEAIQEELGVSARTFRRWRRESVEIVAQRLGLLV